MVAFRNSEAFGPVDDEVWQADLAAAERAVQKLLRDKQELLRVNPVAEHVLWHRYHERVMKLRRNMESIAY